MRFAFSLVIVITLFSLGFSADEEEVKNPGITMSMDFQLIEDAKDVYFEEILKTINS